MSSRNETSSIVARQSIAAIVIYHFRTCYDAVGVEAIGDAVEQHRDAFGLSSRKRSRFDERKTTLGHFKGFAWRSVGNVKQGFVPSTFASDALLSFSARNPANAIRVKAKPQFLVPVFLFLGEANE